LTSVSASSRAIAAGPLRRKASRIASLEWLPTVRRRNSAAFSSVSPSAPTLDACCEPGIQVVAADRAVVPPSSFVRSTSSTRWPPSAEKSAAAMPAPPAPTTTTS
jgi:hypothetical protein